MTTSPKTRVEIEIKEENLWFLQRYLNVFDFFDLFPSDAFGEESKRGVPVTFQTDLGFEIQSDIDRAKMQLRNRSKHHGWIKWVTGHPLNPGDTIVIERTGERTFLLRLEPKQTVSH